MLVPLELSRRLPAHFCCILQPPGPCSCSLEISHRVSCGRHQASGVGIDPWDRLAALTLPCLRSPMKTKSTTAFLLTVCTLRISVGREGQIVQMFSVWLNSKAQRLFLECKLYQRNIETPKARFCSPPNQPSYSVLGSGPASAICTWKEGEKHSPQTVRPCPVCLQRCRVESNTE